MTPDPSIRPPYRFYGRRFGKKLRARQAWLMANRLPALTMLPAGEGAAVIDPRRRFDKNYDQIWLEIGFGGGEHLIAQAASHPNTGLIGCEPFVNGMAKAVAEMDRQGLTNIRFHPEDARPLLERLRPASIDRVFLLYPDPWPKKRHHQRRFVSQENLDLLARVMKPGAELRFATDIPDYVTWTLAHMRRREDFSWTAARADDWRTRPADWPASLGATRYEIKAQAAGRVPAYLTFRRTPVPDPERS